MENYVFKNHEQRVDIKKLETTETGV
ncbi:hypothetical protein NC652_005901 [Populus alba x Populus x berolinensis]|uniref:Uncharacterized protein n=1 Tax=Populus alba x Populus x berolinensis TaxID=444605 RepID=A0AAD6WCB9_9ROSI|nr:hypothetical protein NC652_005901 [Populus alba x Populus x berolinensis]KAJ7006591.1 hypothetical protein NC653_005830 [Populus alba x Populus x berolinensis]